MKAVTGALPEDEEGWGFELKWDGMRVLAYLDATGSDPTTRLVSANGKDATATFPELAPLAAEVAGHAALLDGEVVAFTEPTAEHPARPDFGLLQRRMHVQDGAEARRRAAGVPATFVAFDLLHLDDRSLLSVPCRDRSRLLRDLLPTGPAWLVPAAWTGTGADLYALAEERGLEGVMAKRLDSPYLPGRRSSTWRKVKVRRRQELVVGGWTEGTGNREGDIGSLLLGVVDDPDDPGEPLRLRFAGRVGTGLGARERARLAERFRTLATGDSPFTSLPSDPAHRAAHFVRPEVVAEVEFGEWTADGVLRHPSYLGTRDDKDPAEVVREPS